MRNMPIDEKLSFFSRAGVWVGGLVGLLFVVVRGVVFAD